ncbi:MAG TPA: hypothetical protein VFK52_11290 [Nocardioidaceae bacterium]|nr:hypothetical protein [Nocardioidaceae bacterium]
MAAAFKTDLRALLAASRALLVVLVIAGVAWSVTRGGDEERLSSSPPSTTLPVPTDLPTVYPTPDFTLPPIPPLTAAPARGTWEFVGSTANLYVGMSSAEALADLNLLAQDSAVIGLNEVTRERAGLLRSWASAREGWTFFSPTSPSNAYQGLNAVLVDTKVFKVLDQGVLFGSRSSMTGYRINSRWITWMLLEHKRSSTRVSWVQTHMDAAVESNGRPRGGSGQRIRNNLEYMRVLQSTVERLAQAGEVVVAGDWNVDASADRQVQDPAFPYAVLQGYGSDDSLPGLRSVYTELGLKSPSTSPGRWIDYILTWKRPAAERVLSVRDYRILAPVNSDHNPVQAIFRIHR